MDNLNYAEILKWVLIVLGAGFIGHFGRVFAEHLIDRVRKKKASSAGRTELSNTRPEPAAAILPEQEPPKDKTGAKAESKARKKALKAEIKLRKKGK
jgi:hypothetical protein